MTASDSPVLTVTVAISTLGQGLARIRLPRVQAGVDYLILVQAPQDMPKAVTTALQAGREDVTLVELSNLGLSHSRNAGLERATGDLVLFSDDDVTLELEGILALRECFAAQAHWALVAGWRAERRPRSAPNRPLAAEDAQSATRLTLLNSGRICAPEFMVRRTAVQALGVRFDPEFGIGARYESGEDYVFITDILRAGGQGYAVPVVTGSHPHASTGDRWDDPVLLAARRAVICRVFGVWSPAIILAYALRHRRRFASAALLWRFVFN